MSLEEELRTTLEREADVRTAPSPDVTGTILRGRARRRRRNVVRLGVGVVATVLVAATAFGVLQADPRAEGEVTSPPGRTETARETPPPLSVNGRFELAPGTYRQFVGRGATGDLISADVTLRGPHWTDGDFVLVSNQKGSTYAGFGVYQPQALAAGTGCEDDLTTSALGDTPGRLAEQLAGLPRSTVLQEPAHTDLFDLTAVHLRLRIDTDCPGYYRVAHAAGGTRGISYVPREAAAVDVVIDFWVLDVEGEPVVIDQWHNVDAPSRLVDQAREARESITFVEGE